MCAIDMILDYNNYINNKEIKIMIHLYNTL